VPPSLKLEDRLRLAFGREIAEQAAVRVRRHIGSRTLREAMRVTTDGRSWWLGVPHYWAAYYHDGRDRARPHPPTRYLVWYPNPADDPRHGGVYPERVRDIQKLDIPLSQLSADVKAGRAVIARVSPRNKRRAKANPFFVKGLRGFFNTGGAKRAAAFSKHAKEVYPGLYKQRVFKLSITPPVPLV
jgi:hypothetical protein